MSSFALVASDTTSDTETDAPEPAPEQSPADDTSEKLKTIYELEDEVQACESDYLTKAELAKAAKKRLEAAQSGLNRFIRRLQEELPLFDRPVSAPKPEAWRDDSVRLLEGLSESIYESFEEAGLFTVGQLCDWRQTHDLIELPGIGATKVTKIEEAMGVYWARDNVAQPADEPEEVET